MKQAKKPKFLIPFSMALLLLSLALPATGREALSPSEAPDLFFDSVYKMDYVQAWQVLTHDSQEAVLKLIQETEKDPKLSNANLRKLFESGDRAVQRGFWTQLRESMDIEAWNKQKFGEPRNGDKPEESFVHVMPANIYVFVRQENQNWKFGFQESFVERRRPQGLPRPAKAAPVASPAAKNPGSHP